MINMSDQKYYTPINHLVDLGASAAYTYVWGQLWDEEDHNSEEIFRKYI